MQIPSNIIQFMQFHVIWRNVTCVCFTILDQVFCRMGCIFRCQCGIFVTNISCCIQICSLVVTTIWFTIIVNVHYLITCFFGFHQIPNAKVETIIKEIIEIKLISDQTSFVIDTFWTLTIICLEQSNGFRFLWVSLLKAIVDVARSTFSNQVFFPHLL